MKTLDDETMERWLREVAENAKRGEQNRFSQAAKRDLNMRWKLCEIAIALLRRAQDAEGKGSC